MKFFLLFFVLAFAFSGCELPERPASSPRSRNPERHQGPENIVEEFYELYFQCLKNKEVVMLDSCLEVQAKRPYLTKANRARIDKIVYDLQEPDLNPFLCARNIPDKEYSVGFVTISDHKAEVTAIFRYGEIRHRVPITLVEEKGIWKIDQIDCSNAAIEQGS